MNNFNTHRVSTITSKITSNMHQPSNAAANRSYVKNVRQIRHQTQEQQPDERDSHGTGGWIPSANPTPAYASGTQLPRKLPMTSIMKDASASTQRALDVQRVVLIANNIATAAPSISKIITAWPPQKVLASRQSSRSSRGPNAVPRLDSRSHVISSREIR